MAGSPMPILHLEQVLLVTRSPLLARRVEEAVGAEGVTVQILGGAREVRGLRRQRPFLLGFLDARAEGGDPDVEGCFRARPGERYVAIRNPGTGEPVASGAHCEFFGFLREPFTSEEVRTWCRRAATEANLLRGDRSLDDLLYGKFRDFLSNLGSSSEGNLHDLVWERVERPLLTAVLEATGGNQSRAAQILGLHRNTLRAKIRTLGIGSPRGGGS